MSVVDRHRRFAPVMYAEKGGCGARRPNVSADEHGYCLQTHIPADSLTIGGADSCYTKGSFFGNIYKEMEEHYG